MAIVSYPPGSPGINISKGGATFSANFNGSIIRSHKKGINYRSIRNSVRRTNFLHVVQYWRTLSTFNKQGWIDYRLEVPRVNSLGETYFLTGFQLFVSFNQVRVNQNLSIMDFPQDPDPVTPVSITSVNFDISPVDIVIYFTPLLVQADFEYRFWATAIFSDGLELVFPDDFKLIHTLNAGESSPLLLGPYWQAIYGSGPTIIPQNKVSWVIFIAVESYDVQTNNSLFQDQFKALVIQ